MENSFLKWISSPDFSFAYDSIEFTWSKCTSVLDKELKVANIVMYVMVSS